MTRPAVGRKGRFSVGIAARESLWLGKDHLLSIASTWFTEQYKRFYFRDIQAITIRKTQRREVWNVILSLLSMISLTFLIRAFRRSGFSSDLLPSGIMTGITAVPLVINNILGTACTCYIRTAVQIEELPSINRVRRAYKIIARIRPLIAAAQGELTAEQVSTGMRQLAEADAAAEIAKRRVVTSPLNLP